ncbi:urease accessory protein UreD [Borborobacter arsenicus]|uniref:urease accessory protein UreD n=1 Tax=Borborobacter arsenicus TaxID=1851146 RepID=UPI001404630E|nr:urease accessory protein UreD [Pseudaminobacter arsenicus]
MGAVLRKSDAVAKLQRSHGQARICLDRQGNGATGVRTLFQDGCLKLRLPRSPCGEGAEVVVINTAGGLTGGDKVSIDVTVGANASATVTTPGSERIYRSLQDDVVMEQRLTVLEGGRLDWLPQETILFDKSRLRRRFEVELHGSAEATIAESILFGRAAMGEAVESGFFADFWTIRRDGGLIFADATRIAEAFAATVGNAATLGGRAAMATLVHVGKDLEAKRDAMRTGFAAVEAAAAGASIVGDVLVARITAPSGMLLRSAMIPALAILRYPRLLPRLWTC